MKFEIFDNFMDDIEDVDNAKEALGKTLFFLGGIAVSVFIGKGASNVMELKRRNKAI